MEKFTYYNPTEIHFGKDSELLSGDLCAAYGNKVLLHYGSNHVVKSGLLETITKSLLEKDMKITTLSGVMPNPRVELVREGISLCRQNSIQIILAVGGGSVVDSAKAIAAGVYYEKDVWELFCGATTEKALPVGVVLTIPAAGSESGATTVLSNEQTKEKNMFTHQALRPKFAMLNPLLTKTIPPFSRACGICDMFSHVLERYFTPTKEVSLTDRLCEALMKTIVKSGLAAMENPNNEDALSQLMLAANYAHNDMVGVGRQQDWANHMMEHQISAQLDVAHGAGLSVIIPNWMSYVYKKDISRFARFGRCVFSINETNDEKAALMAIAQTKHFFQLLKLPTSIFELEPSISTEILHLIAKKSCQYGSIGNFMKLNEDDVVAILGQNESVL